MGEGRNTWRQGSSRLAERSGQVWQVVLCNTSATLTATLPSSYRAAFRKAHSTGTCKPATARHVAAPLPEVVEESDADTDGDDAASGQGGESDDAVEVIDSDDDTGLLSVGARPRRNRHAQKRSTKPPRGARSLLRRRQSAPVVRRVPVAAPTAQRPEAAQLKPGTSLTAATTKTGAGNPTLRKGLTVGGGGGGGGWASEEESQRAAASSLLAPVLSRALAISINAVAAVAATPTQPVAAAFIAAAVAAVTARRIVATPGTRSLLAARSQLTAQARFNSLVARVHVPSRMTFTDKPVDGMCILPAAVPLHGCAYVSPCRHTRPGWKTKPATAAAQHPRYSRRN